MTSSSSFYITASGFIHKSSRSRIYVHHLPNVSASSIRRRRQRESFMLIFDLSLRSSFIKIYRNWIDVCGQEYGNENLEQLFLAIEMNCKECTPRV